MAVSFDDILDQVGEFGCYQKVLTLLLCLPAVFCAMQALSYVFTSAVPKHRCFVEGCDNATSGYCEDFVNFTIPWDSSKELYEECRQYASINGSTEVCSADDFTNTTADCQDWKFDDSVYEATAVTKWNLVCGDSDLVALSQTLLMVGIMVGSLVFGALADWIGRKNTILVAVVIGVSTASALPFLPYYPIFLAFKVLNGAAFQGVYQASFVMTIEIVGKSKRAFCGMLVSVFYAIGEVILGVLAYFVRDWKDLQLIISVIPIIIITYYWVIPESPRWMLSRRRQSEAIRVLERIVRSNNKSLPYDLLNADREDIIIKDDVAESSVSSDSSPHVGKTQNSTLDLFRTPRLRWRSINIFLNWFMNTIAYYGITMSTPTLGGNEFWNFVIISAVEVPSYVFGMLVLDRFGRRLPLCGCMIIGGIAGTCTALVPTSPDYQWLSITLAMIGKFGAAAAFGIIYVFSAELFPTVIRNNGIGLSSLIGHIGGAIAPYVATLSSVSVALPLVIYGAFSLASGLAAITLPETLGRTLPETIEDAESFGGSPIEECRTLWIPLHRRREEEREDEEEKRDEKQREDDEEMRQDKEKRDEKQREDEKEKREDEEEKRDEKQREDEKEKRENEEEKRDEKQREDDEEKREDKEG